MVVIAALVGAVASGVPGRCASEPLTSPWQSKLASPFVPLVIVSDRVFRNPNEEVVPDNVGGGL